MEVLVQLNRIQIIKELREELGLSLKEIMKAVDLVLSSKVFTELKEIKNNVKEILNKNNANISEKKASRELKHGAIGSYIHFGETQGALVYLACETDFVSRNVDFKKFANELAKHAVVYFDELRLQLVAQEQGIISEPVLDIWQFPWFRDQILTVKELLEENIAKFGERIEIVDFKVLKVK